MLEAALCPLLEANYVESLVVQRPALFKTGKETGNKFIQTIPMLI